MQRIIENERERHPLQLSLFGFGASPLQHKTVPSEEAGSAPAALSVDYPEAEEPFLDSHGTDERPWSEREFEAWAPPDSSLVSEWALKHRVLSPRFSAFPGPWIHRAYYGVEIMDAFLDPIVEDLTMMAAAQSCKTDIAYNMLGYAIDQDPAPALVSMPTDKTIGRVNERIKDMIDESPALQKHLTGREDDISLKKFKLDRMNLHFVTAGSSSDLRNVLARYIFEDEVDDYPKSTGEGTQGSPMGQIEARGTTFWNRKKVKLCTPTLEDGNINLEYEKSDKRKRHVPCPFCFSYQILSFWRIKHVGCKLGEWPKDKRDKDYILSNNVARYECEHCGAEIEEKYKPWMDYFGTWVPEGHPIEKDGTVAIPMPRTRHRGYQWGAQISPFRTWGEMAAKYFEVKGNVEDYKVFVNLWLGEPWKEVVKKRETTQILALCNDRPPLVVPPGSVALTAGIDNQKHGKWVVIRAWQRDLSSHRIRHGFVETWEELEQWLFLDVYGIEGTDITLPVWRAGIDTGGGEAEDPDGGTMTEQVYDWLRKSGRGVIYGFKGLSRPIGGGKKMKLSVIDKMPGKNGRAIPGGIRLWLVDTALMKDALWSRIESGKFHLNSDQDEVYARHLTAEAKEKERGRYIWKVQGSRPNHLLDAEIIAASMADPECNGGVLVVRTPSQETETRVTLSPKKKEPRW